MQASFAKRGEAYEENTDLFGILYDADIAVQCLQHGTNGNRTDKCPEVDRSAGSYGTGGGCGEGN